jgi:hypothetical protein
VVLHLTALNLASIAVRSLIFIQNHNFEAILVQKIKPGVCSNNNTRIAPIKQAAMVVTNILVPSNNQLKNQQN